MTTLSQAIAQVLAEKYPPAKIRVTVKNGTYHEPDKRTDFAPAA